MTGKVAMPQVYKIGKYVIKDIPFTLANNRITTSKSIRRCASFIVWF